MLDLLYSDQTRYVTRSVAKHLNDLSKKQPDLVVETLARWRGRGNQDPKEMRWITGHALRTLVKRGNPAALALLGYRQNPDISPGPIRLEPQDGMVTSGGVLAFSCELTALREEPLLVDFIIDFVKKDGGRKPKVFKLKQLMLGKGETAVLRKKHRLLGNATTFKVFPGKHRLSLLVNGTVMAVSDFELVES